MTVSRTDIQPLSRSWIALFSLLILQNLMPVIGRVVSTYLTTYFMLLIVMLIFIRFLSWRLNWWFNLLLPLFVVLAINLIYSVVHGEPLTISVYGVLLSICPVLIALRMPSLPSSQQKTLFMVMSAGVIITVITTINGLATHPGASRTLATFSESDDPLLIEFEWLNIGGFTFTYLLLTIYPAIIGLIRETYDKLWLKVLVVWLFATYYLSAEYMTALMGFIILSSLWILPKGIPLKNLLALISVLLIFFIIFNGVLADILYDSAMSSESGVLKARFKYMADGLSGVENDSDVGLREESLMASVIGILQSPILGNWYTGGGIGGHSFILDFISLYGIVGVILLVMSYKVIFRQFYLKYSNTEYYSYAVMSFCTAIVLSTVNTGSHWLELTLFVPLILRMIDIIKAKRA